MKMSKFQIIVIVIFIVCLIAGIIAFATFKGSSTSTSTTALTIWGTVSADVVNPYVSKINLTLPEALGITYVRKSPESFSKDFIAALARGQGPDAILISADTLTPFQDVLTTIPYTALPQRTYIDTYVQEARIYEQSTGVLAMPFLVDPLVMYWNRDIFSSVALATYPKYWDEFSDVGAKITLRDSNGNITRSTLAMGDFGNVDNAREILGTLLMQLGNPITKIDDSNRLVSALRVGNDANPTTALGFFTKYVDPSNKDYSWNKGLPSAKSQFLSGKLAVYFGFASELSDIKTKNPNLNFDVAPMPQIRKGGLKTTYGRMYGFSIVKSSPNANAAFSAISTMLAPQYMSDLSKTLYLPSIRNDVISAGSGDPYVSVFNSQALISRTWLDTDPNQSRAILGNMVSDITSGRKNINDALQDASDQYDVVLNQSAK